MIFREWWKDALLTFFLSVAFLSYYNAPKPEVTMEWLMVPENRDRFWADEKISYQQDKAKYDRLPEGTQKNILGITLEYRKKSLDEYDRDRLQRKTK